MISARTFVNIVDMSYVEISLALASECNFLFVIRELQLVDGEFLLVHFAGPCYRSTFKSPFICYTTLPEKPSIQLVAELQRRIAVSSHSEALAAMNNDGNTALD